MAKGTVLEPILRSVTETAAQFNVSKTLIRSLIAAGTLPSVLVGRRRLIPAAEAAAWIQARTVGGTATK